MTRDRRIVPHAVWPPVLFGIAFLSIWEAAVVVFDWKPYFLPKPSSIWDEFVDNFSLDPPCAAIVSGTNALIGLVLGTLFGGATELRAHALRRSTTWSRRSPWRSTRSRSSSSWQCSTTCSPSRRGSAAADGDPRRVLHRARQRRQGLRQVERTHLELLRSYAATPSQVLAKARVPNAVPYLFTALKIAAPAAVITAFVAEYFGGSQNGLGTRITSNLTANVAAAWAYVFGACLLGLAFFLVSIGLESITTHHRGGSPGEEQHEDDEDTTCRPGGRRARHTVAGRRRLRRRSTTVARRPASQPALRPAPRRRARRPRHRTRRPRHRAPRRRAPPRRRRVRPRRPASARASTRCRCSCSGSSRPSSAATIAAQDQGFYAALPRRRASSRAAVDIVPQQQLADGAVDFAIAWVPKALQTREQGADIVNIAQIFQRSGTLQVSFKDAGDHEPGGLPGQEDRQLGLRQRVRDLRRPVRGGPRPGHRRRLSCSSSSTWSASCRATSTPPRR